GGDRSGRVHDRFPGEIDVLGGDRGSVVPDRVWVQVVGHGHALAHRLDPAVVDRRSVTGEERRRLELVVDGELHDLRHHLLLDRVEVPGRERARGDRVQALRPLFRSEHGFAAGVRRAGSTGTAAGATAAGTRDRNHGEYHGHAEYPCCEPSTHPGPPLPVSRRPQYLWPFPRATVRTSAPRSVVRNRRPGRFETWIRGRVALRV